MELNSSKSNMPMFWLFWAALVAGLTSIVFSIDEELNKYSVRATSSGVSSEFSFSTLVASTDPIPSVGFWRYIVSATPKISENFRVDEANLVSVIFNISKLTPPNADISRYTEDDFTSARLRAEDHLRQFIRVSLELAGANVKPTEPRAIDSGLSASWSVSASSDAKGFISFHRESIFTLDKETDLMSIPSDVEISLSLETPELAISEVLSSIPGSIGAILSSLGILGFWWRWQDRKKIKGDEDKPRIYTGLN